MALWDGIKKVEGSRSNTALIKSGHMSPAEYWILDNNFKSQGMSAIFNDGVLFEYQYGGPGMTEVVIPKGRIVGVGAPVKDFQFKKFVNVMSLPGMTVNGNTIGVVPYNITKNWFQQDKFGGNQPSVITLDYIEIPYIPSMAAANTMDVAGVLDEELRLSVQNKMPWGAAIGEGIVPGDYVKATASGRFTKWIKGTDDYTDIIGQVLAVDFNAEPWGWLKWAMWDETAKKEDDLYVNKSGASNLPGDAGYPYDPNFAVGTREMDGYLNQFTTNPTGILGLHDGSGNYVGYGKNDTEYTNKVLGTFANDVANDDLVIFNTIDFAGAPLKNLQSGTVTVKIDGDVVAPERLTIDYKKGIIVIKALETDAGLEVTASYKAYHYGTQSALDFKGVEGALRILLMK